MDVDIKFNLIALSLRLFVSIKKNSTSFDDGTPMAGKENSTTIIKYLWIKEKTERLTIHTHTHTHDLFFKPTLLRLSFFYDSIIFYLIDKNVDETLFIGTRTLETKSHCALYLLFLFPSHTERVRNACDMKRYLWKKTTTLINKKEKNNGLELCV